MMDKSRMPIAMKEKKRGRYSIILRFIGFILSLISGMEAATIFFASRLNFHSVLGERCFDYCYAPWKIIEWYFTWGSQAEETFKNSFCAGLGVTGILLGIMAFIIMSKKSGELEESGNEFMHGSAKWASRADIERAGLFSNDGVYVGGWQDEKGNLYYLRHNGSEHLLCIAPTRSGKGICLVVPTLLTWKESCVITDLKGELWALTSGWRRSKNGGNNTVLLFEPASKEGSIHWNPMDEIRLDSEYEIGDVQNLATMIVDPDGKGLNDHWQKTAQALLVGCILHLLYCRKNGECEEASLPAVDAMLSDEYVKKDEEGKEQKGIAVLWEKMKETKHKDNACHPVVAKAAQDMLDRPEEEAGSVLSTLKSYLSLFRDPVVGGNCSDSEFKVHDLMDRENEPVSLYIVTQPADKARLRPLVRILVNMICRVLAGKMLFKTVDGSRRGSTDHKHKLLMMMDEFPSLGKLEIVQESLAFLAGYGIRFYIICQDITQLKSKEIGYGEDEAISSNCHIQNAFQPNRLDTAKYLSEMTGTTTVVKEQYSVSSDIGFTLKKNITRSMQEVSRPLMTPDECLRMAPPEKRGDKLIKGGAMLLYLAGFPTIYGRQMPYFLDPVFNERVKLDPPGTTEYLKDVKQNKVDFTTEEDVKWKNVKNA